MAFIFDHLLLGNVNQSNGAPPISKVARVFLQCLATIQYPLDAILVLVTEFKLAFSRALALPETQLKHVRVRTLASLLSQILDSQNNSLHSRVPTNPSHFSRLLIRRGFISDLARATHSLSLNSSHLVGTINNILKPLEVLTRIVNQVASSQCKIGTDTTPPAKTTTSSNTQTGSGTRQTSQTATDSQPAPPTTTQSTPSTQATQPTQSEASGSGEASGASLVASMGQEGCTSDAACLEATHESLIPLEEEEDEGEREQRQEIISLAHELGRQHRELAVAGSGDMDIQVYTCTCTY